MRVQELMGLLSTFDGNAFVVIDGKIVAGAEQIAGRFGGDKHWPDTFRPADAGREKAVVFLHHTEFSDGSQGLARS